MTGTPIAWPGNTEAFVSKTPTYCCQRCGGSVEKAAPSLASGVPLTPTRNVMLGAVLAVKMKPSVFNVPRLIGVGKLVARVSHHIQHSMLKALVVFSLASALYGEASPFKKMSVLAPGNTGPPI